MKHRQTAVIATISVFAACSGGSETGATSDPRLLSLNLPFVYPPALYAAGVEGDVALRLFIDSNSSLKARIVCSCRTGTMLSMRAKSIGCK